MAFVPPLFRSCSSVGFNPRHLRKSPTLLASTKPSRPSQKSNKSNTSVQSVKTNKRWERLTLMWEMQGCLTTSFRNQSYAKIHTHVSFLLFESTEITWNNCWLTIHTETPIKWWKPIICSWIGLSEVNFLRYDNNIFVYTQLVHN